MTDYFRGLGPGEVAMLVAAVLLLCASSFVLWGWRWGKRYETGERPRFSFPGVGEVSEPTRLVAGCFGLVLAYHLVVWTLPPSATPLRVGKEWWWVLVVVGGGAVGASLLMDRGERGEKGAGE